MHLGRAMSNPMSVLIVEQGARWAWNVLDHGGEDCLILAQQADEDAETFAKRVADRLKKSTRGGKALRKTVVSTGPDQSPAAMHARRRVSELLATIDKESLVTFVAPLRLH